MFEQHPSLTYRVSQLEIAQAAERARVIAENADRLPPRRGLLTRLRDASARRRASRGPAASPAADVRPAPAAASTAPVPTTSPTAATSCAASPRLAPGRSAASRPAPVASRATASRSV
ncbi:MULTISPECIES: hypothetical protein [Bacteria]|uniref:hypothetical protein n=1 Tax=Bacteria TaxID=2 RepID=UPI003C7A4837